LSTGPTNYPNPFNPSTTIYYALGTEAFVDLRLYDAAGSEVICLVDGWEAAGSKKIVWDGSGRDGSPVASGIYFYQLRVNGSQTTGRMMLLK
jgi:hypothetical protein